MSPNIMNDINALAFRRGTIKGQLTKFSNVVNNFSKDDDLIQLMVKKEKIEEGWTEFQNIQSTIEQKSINPENEELYRDEFENLYYTAVAGYIRLVEKYKKVEGPSSVQVSNEIENNAGQSVSSARSSVSNQASIVKLAALNVPNFSGDYKAWSTFNDMFTALIHSNEALTDIQKCLI